MSSVIGRNETAVFTLDQLEEAARIVYSVLAPTPAIAWPLLKARTGAETWVKHENHTPIGAFKVRGGLVYLSRLVAAQPGLKGVITPTRGNHGQSVGFAARRLGVPATIVVPHGNNPEKNAAMRALGVTLIEHGRDFQDAFEFAERQAAERGLHFWSTWQPDLVRGVASYSLEFLRAAPDLDTVYLPIGHGSGICGMIAARDALSLETKVVGVVSENAAAYALSFAAGKPVSTDSADTIADGVACRVPDPRALAVILKGAERIVTVSDAEVIDAMAVYFVDTHNLAEGAGALPLAALMKERERMKGRKVGLVLTGANVDRVLYRRVLERAATIGEA
jgi:threonine dehydratase